MWLGIWRACFLPPPFCWQNLIWPRPAAAIWCTVSFYRVWQLGVLSTTQYAVRARPTVGMLSGAHRAEHAVLVSSHSWAWFHALL